MNINVTNLPILDEEDAFWPFISFNGKIFNLIKNNVSYAEPEEEPFTKSGSNGLYSLTYHLKALTVSPELYMINIDYCNNITSTEIIKAVKLGYIPYAINLFNEYCETSSLTPTTLIFSYYDDTSESGPFAYFAPIYPLNNYNFEEFEGYMPSSFSKSGQQTGVPFGIQILAPYNLIGIGPNGQIFMPYKECSREEASNAR